MYRMFQYDTMMRVPRVQRVKTIEVTVLMNARQQNILIIFYNYNLLSLLL
jgi:hypothetical protein